MELTPKIVAYVASEEGMVCEAYKDSVGVWTWALGVTNASGHQVYPRYLDNPQPFAKCLEVSVWLMREKYLPAVAKAFAGRNLNEAQIAAALGFHWNTGKIMLAQWVRDWKDGKPNSAKANILNYRKPAVLLKRRERERALFFDGKWPPLTVPVYPVSKATHAPIWGRAEKVDLLPVLEQLQAGGWA